MPVTQYPALVIQFGLGGANVPFINYCYDLKNVEDYNVLVQEFEDKGRDFLILSDGRVRRWMLWYPTLLIPESVVLDTHMDSARGIGYGFIFAHPKTGVIYQNVHYEEYEAPEHEKLHLQARRIVLAQYPS